LSKKENLFEQDDLPEILPPKNDIVFKMLFGDKKNEDILIDFLQVVLNKNINKVLLLNPINKQENETDKLSVLDVKAELENGEIIDIEMQACNLPELRSRISYYSARMLVEQIGKGGKYLDIKPVISIIIVEKSLVLESKKCHNVFSMLEEEELFPFSDLQKIHILDLSRIEREKNEKLSDWLIFINSEKEEDFMKVATKNKTINSAFSELKVLSADRLQRERYEARLKMQRDIWSREDAAKKNMALEIFEYLEKGYSIADARKNFLVH